MKYTEKFFVCTFAIGAIFFVSNFLNMRVVSAAVTSITKIVFTTESQSLGVGVISGDINIQTQNSSDTSESLDETGDLSLTSTSGTGEFSSSATSWTPATTFTMNKTWANRKFYYRDNSSGNFTITAKLTTRTTGKSWTTTQSITIGSSSGGSAGDDTGESSTTTATSTTTSTDSGSETDSISNSSHTVYSTHYVEETLSNYIEPTNVFEVSAGRGRVTYTGSPISFEAKYKTSTDLKNITPNCTWSFGDGSIFTGDKVVHDYKYPGEYNVVLNATLQDLNSVSRTKVNVLSPNLILSVLSDGAVEIYNKSATEINLYSWKLQSANQMYVFPLDTIISAGKKITFSPEVLKIPTFGTVVILTDALGKNVVQSNPNILSSVVENKQRTVTTADFEDFVTNYNNLNRESRVENVNINNLEKPPVKNISIPMSASILSAVIATSVDDQLEDVSLNLAIDKISTKGFWSKLFHPIQTIKETFYR